VAPEKILYKRLRRIGLGAHVVKVLPSRRGHGGAHFLVRDDQAFLDALVRSGQFAMDRAIGRVFHRGTISLRELSSKSGLHLSLHQDKSVDVHVDIVSPVVGTTPDGRCRYGPGRASAHFRHDVVPMVLRRHPRRQSGGANRACRTSEWIHLSCRQLSPISFERNVYLGPAPLNQPLATSLSPKTSPTSPLPIDLECVSLTLTRRCGNNSVQPQPVRGIGAFRAGSRLAASAANWDLDEISSFAKICER
jgi:hypothetical protein